LAIEGPRGNNTYKVRADTKLNAKADFVIFATKINDIEKAIIDNHEHLKEAVVLSTQNGIEADYILKKYFPAQNIITGIVMFGATYYPPNRIVHNFEGDLVLGSMFGEKIRDFGRVKELLGTTFKVNEIKNIKGAKFLKVFINLNNCIPAVLGISMQEAFSDTDIAKLAIQLNREAYGVVTKSGIELEGLPTYPKERLSGLVSMPVDEATQIFSKVMTSLSDKPLYGSILQSIKRDRPSEIDYINGQIVKLALENNLEAPLNKNIVDLVHRVEETKKFFSKEELLSQIKNVL
jgi:2-dehydropantoate 2-reductase